jgi:nitrate/TMAO reductase-like tetraheme cytochrome c subunit
MRKLLLFLLFVSIVSTAIAAEKARGVGYVGSEVCSTCHGDIYNKFVDSGHPYKLRKAELAKAAGIPLPKGYTWDDISYVIGGKMKKARYIDLNGYIITTDKDGNPMPTQYNLEDGSWSNYHAGEITPYKCGPCHMTNYSKEGNQDGKAGMIGTWAADGVQCEECHGPASAHIIDPKANKLKVDDSAEACGKCHIRGSSDMIPASKGFIRHHEQFNELLAGAHKDLSCVVCHDPHAKIEVGVKSECSDCHSDVAEKFVKNNIHGQNKIDCISCHMPRVGKSATNPDSYVGDIRTHLFKITSDANYKMFSEDGKTALNALSLEYTCLTPGCHAGRDKKWASEGAVKIHK